MSQRVFILRETFSGYTLASVSERQLFVNFDIATESAQSRLQYRHPRRAGGVRHEKESEMSDIRTTSGIRALLRHRLPSTPMTFPGEMRYDVFEAAWHVRGRYRPVGLVEPRDKDEIITILACLRHSEVAHLITRSGGHTFQGLNLSGDGDTALVLDLVNFRRVETDLANHAIILQGGALLNDLYRTAWNRGEFAVPMRDHPPNQVATSAPEGESRGRGLLSGQVLQCEVLTADGTLCVIDRHTDPDLFRALRNGGPGIITAITLDANTTLRGDGVLPFPPGDFIDIFRPVVMETGLRESVW
ncbi:FAD-binding protein [Nocardia sp. NPDC046473]|uniref:FAD-binding protein n=1 Tax=Nocardia sp. NPDC046473 TaxID=3155733 RepID=UPI0033D9EF01